MLCMKVPHETVLSLGEFGKPHLIMMRVEIVSDPSRGKQIRIVADLPASIQLKRCDLSALPPPGGGLRQTPAGEIADRTDRRNR